MKKLKIPNFKNEDEEREFWDSADTTKYFDPKKFIKVKFPNLKPTTKPVTLRMPAGLIDDLKIIANKKDVPYQSLAKIWLAEKVREEYSIVHK